MRNANQDVADAKLLGVVLGAAAHHHLRLALGIVANLDVGPRNPPAPARAQAFQDGFLGGPAPGEMFGRVFSRLAITYLSFRVYPRPERLPMLLHHPPNAEAFHNISSGSDNVIHRNQDGSL